MQSGQQRDYFTAVLSHCLPRSLDVIYFLLNKICYRSIPCLSALYALQRQPYHIMRMEGRPYLSVRQPVPICPCKSIQVHFGLVLRPAHDSRRPIVSWVRQADQHSKYDIVHITMGESWLLRSALMAQCGCEIFNLIFLGFN
jgi:hypothetical protein